MELIVRSPVHLYDIVTCTGLRDLKLWVLDLAIGFIGRLYYNYI